MILPISNIYSYNSIPRQNINFQAVPVKEIKNLHALTCPRCGGPIIEPQKLIEAYRTISSPLKQMIKKGYLDRSKPDTAIWEMLNNFAEQYPKYSLDKILESEENYKTFRTTIETTLAPGVDLRNREAYNLRVKSFNDVEHGIRKSSRRELRSSSVVMNRLKTFLPYLKEIEQNEPFKNEIQGKIGALEELMYYSTIYPHKTLSEIVNMPEVKSHIEAMKNGLEEEFQHKQKLAFDNVKALIKKNTDCTEEEASEFIKKLMGILFKSNKDPGVRLFYAKDFCGQFLKQKNCTKIYPKITNIIQDIPEPPYNKYKELYHEIEEQNDGKIVDSILKLYVGSSEHFVARSTGGADVRENIISMHKICNARRSNTPYSEYIEIYPRIPYNTEKQVKEVSDYIYRDRLIPKFNTYPIQIARTLRESTDGRINPDVKKYCKKTLKKSQKKQELQQQKMRELTEERDKKIQELHKLQEAERQLREGIEDVNKEHQKTIDAQKEERRLSGYLNKFLETEE